MIIYIRCLQDCEPGQGLQSLIGKRFLQRNLSSLFVTIQYHECSCVHRNISYLRALIYGLAYFIVDLTFHIIEQAITVNKFERQIFFR